MSDQPWQEDCCSLVDAFRAGQRSPVEELEAVLSAIDSSGLNAFCHVDADGARRAAQEADPGLPLGGVPVAVKELDPVEGWPATEASLVFRDRVGVHDATVITRLRRAGAVPVGMTTASEFGGLNISVSRLHGVTRNPWGADRTTGGSSAGSAAAVAGGIVTLATGGDGGGSIRIPAGFTGLPGLKGTAGRIPRGPRTVIGPLTVVLGCLSRSVRDIARYYDVTNGFDSRDPYSLPRVDGWEAGLGTHELAGRRAVIAPTLGSAAVRPEVEALVVEAAEELARSTGLVLVDAPVQLPSLGFEWAMANLATLLEELGDRYPACGEDLTTEIAFGLKMASEMFNLQVAARGEAARTRANEAMADVFDSVDFVFCATNPDVAFGADVTLNTRVGDLTVGPENNGALTIPANISGNPAVSIPAGTVDGLPVGLQVIGRHHEDALLLDLALTAERVRPWPLVAPGAPC
ncbi:MAG TPA: amidase [Acidimicrobiales bacterium]|nr:amidase [Acidimicrobiales bacterium]